MSAAFGSFLTALGEGVGDYGQIEHKGTIDALNDQAEMAKAQRLMSLEETQLATSNMFKMANLDMNQQRLDMSKSEAARAEEKYQYEKSLRGAGTWETKTIYPYGQMVEDELGGAPKWVKGQGVEVQINSVTGEMRRLDLPGTITGGGTVVPPPGEPFKGTKSEVETWLGDQFFARYGRKATKDDIATMWKNGVKNNVFTVTDGTTPPPSTEKTKSGKDDGYAGPLPGDPGFGLLLAKEEAGAQKYEDDLDWRTKKYVDMDVVYDKVAEVIETASVDDPADNRLVAKALGFPVDVVAAAINQLLPNDVTIRTPVMGSKWLMENRGWTIADLVNEIKDQVAKGRVGHPGAELARRFGDGEDPVGDATFEKEGYREPTTDIESVSGGTVYPEQRGHNVVGYGPGGLGDIPPTQVGAATEKVDIGPEVKRMMEINEIPEAQGSAAIAAIAHAVAEPVEAVASAIASLPEDSAVIKIIRHWENQDLDEITSAIEMVKKQIAKIIPSTSEPMPEDQFNLARFKAADANSMITVGDGLITGDAPVPVGDTPMLVGDSLPLEHGQDDPRIDDGPGLLDIKVALDPTQRSRRWDTSRGRQGEGGLSMDADYRTLPGTFSRAHGQDDPQEAGTMNRAEIKALLDPTQRHRQEVETDIFKMSYDESIQIIREVVDNLVKSGMSNKEVIDQLLRVVEGTSKSNEKKFNKSAYKKALQDTIIGLHTINK